MSTAHDIDRLLRHFLEIGPAKGCCVSVSRGEETLYENYAGFADLAMTRPLGPENVFRMYSMTKVVAALCGLIQYERGAFLLSDPVSDYLPEYGNMRVQRKREDGSWELVESRQPILMRHAFSMGVGMLAHDGSPADETMKAVRERLGGPKSCNKYDHLTEIRALAEVPMLFEPGTHWQYGQGLELMAAVVEVTSGMKLGDFMRKEIFEPLGMKDTAYRLSGDMDSRMVECALGGDVSPGFAAFLTKAEDRCLQPDAIYECASTGLVSTLPDYTKLAKLLANGGRLGDVQIVGRKSIDLMRRNQLSEQQLREFRSTYLAGYGYGLGVRTMMDPAAGGSNGSVGEFGWSGLLGTWVSVDPEEKTSIVYMHQSFPNREEYAHLRMRAVANGLF